MQYILYIFIMDPKKDQSFELLSINNLVTSTVYVCWEASDLFIQAY